MSSRITSAPNCARVRPARGAAMKAELSMTRTPLRKSRFTTAPLRARPATEPGSCGQSA
ncbi:Uncharacterised protein [Bordetella pertussis]|nr:Uncharacterised protein [Bordetella pertussis]